MIELNIVSPIMICIDGRFALTTIIRVGFYYKIISQICLNILVIADNKNYCLQCET